MLSFRTWLDLFGGAIHCVQSQVFTNSNELSHLESKPEQFVYLVRQYQHEILLCCVCINICEGIYENHILSVCNLI